MSIEVSQQLQQVMHTKVTPKQIAANYILQMSSVELQEAIAQELDENPALEMQELSSCPICGHRVPLELFHVSHPIPMISELDTPLAPRNLSAAEVIG